MLALWAFLTVALAAQATWRGVAPAAVLVHAASRKIDVNRASVAELQVLPGIGPGRAEAVVLERIRGGSFRGLDDLGRVHGFGPRMLARLAPHVVF